LEAAKGIEYANGVAHMHWTRFARPESALVGGECPAQHYVNIYRWP
jgi:hypothetical protein